MKQWTGIACFLVAGLFTACDKDSFKNELADIPTDQFTVEINSAGFNPTALTSYIDQRVLWINADNKVHTVTSSTGNLNSGDMNPGDTYNFTFTAFGEYNYYCSKHPGETGKINVTGVK